MNEWVKEVIYATLGWKVTIIPNNKLFLEYTQVKVLRYLQYECWLYIILFFLTCELMLLLIRS